MTCSADTTGRPRVGVALSGGGARGLAHVGVLRVLESQGVPIDLLAGTSMGGLVAAAYAVGLTPDQMEREALRMGGVRSLSALADRALPRGGLFEGKRVEEYLTRLLGGATFADLQRPLALTAVDLVEGQEVVLRDGSLAEAVRATVSFPGVLAPVRLGHRVLVDGGVLNHLPVNVAFEMGADVVIGVDVQRDFHGVGAEDGATILGQWYNAVTSLRACLSVMQMHLTELRLASARPYVLVKPVLPEGAAVLTGFGLAADIIAAGEAAASAALTEIGRYLREPDTAACRRKDE